VVFPKYYPSIRLKNRGVASKPKPRYVRMEFRRVPNKKQEFYVLNCDVPNA
jgi:hypothetical protein